MGDTDKNDQLTRLQRCRRHYRWPRRLTMKFMMWAIFNSCVIHGTLAPPCHARERDPDIPHVHRNPLVVSSLAMFDEASQILPGRVIQESRLLNAPEAPIHLEEHPDNASRNNRCVVCLERHHRAKPRVFRSAKPTSSYASGLATKIASMPTIPKCSTGDKVRIIAILCSVFPVRSFWPNIPVKMTYVENKLHKMSIIFIENVFFPYYIPQFISTKHT